MLSDKEKEFYSDKLILLEDIINDVVEILEKSGKVEYFKTRIKSAKSVKSKLSRKGFDFSADNAFAHLYDLAGVRAVCKYADEIPPLIELFRKSNQFEIVREKNYIASPKSNGYRSYHIIVHRLFPKQSQEYCACCEIQFRTISMDSWASLEHQLKYKKEIKQESMIVSELKKCADEMSSTEVSLMTLRDLINEMN